MPRLELCHDRNHSKKSRWLKKFVDHPPLDEAKKDHLQQKATSVDQAAHRWVPGQSIAAANNAHYTNFPDDLEHAFSSDYNYLEGDVWLEGAVRRVPGLDHFREPIMAHDPDDVGGLTFEEWYDLGLASGKGIKIDIKQSAAVPKILETIEESGAVPPSLIFNADMAFGPGIEKTWKLRALDVLADFSMQVDEMKKVREAHPDAIIAVGHFTAAQPAGTVYTEGTRSNEVIEIAQEIGGPITFPLRAEFVTPGVVAKLKPHGDGLGLERSQKLSASGPRGRPRRFSQDGRGRDDRPAAPGSDLRPPERTSPRPGSWWPADRGPESQPPYRARE